jgi:hypothetical protein
MLRERSISRLQSKHIIRNADIMFLYRKNISFIFLLFFAALSRVLNNVKGVDLSFFLVKNLKIAVFLTF